MKKIILSFFIIFLLSCSSNIYWPVDYHYCYDGNLTNLDSLCAIDGYYECEILDRSKNMNEISFCTLLFYRDGTFAMFEGIPKIDVNYMENERKVFQEQGIKELFSWGRYVLSGDTIKAQAIAKITPIKYYVLERWYLIKDRNTLKELNFCHYSYLSNKDYKKIIKDSSSATREYSLLKFISYPKRTDSLCSLKKYWWYYCRKN